VIEIVTSSRHNNLAFGIAFFHRVSISKGDLKNICVLILVMSLFSNTLCGIGVDEKDKALQLYEKGFQYFHNGDFKTAEKYFMEAARRNQKMSEVYSAIGLCRLFSGDKDWQKWIEKGIKIEPSNPVHYLYQGEGLLLLGKNREALNSFLKAYSRAKIRSERTHLDEVLYYLGYTYNELGDLEKSRCYISQLMHLPTAREEWKGYGYEVLGYYYLQRKQPWKAIECFHAMQELLPEDPYTYRGLGQAYLALTEVSTWWFIPSACVALKMFFKAHQLIQQGKESKNTLFHYRKPTDKVALRNLDYWLLQQIWWLSSALHFFSTVFILFAFLLLPAIVAIFVLWIKIRKIKKNITS